jgi:RNA polymerase sigma-70 factor (ECF subfamily)
VSQKQIDPLRIDKDNDTETVKAARTGDVEAFAVLYKRYYAAMVWLAYSVLLDWNLAEDAAQQAFVLACERLPDLKRADRFSPWLATICRHTAQDIIRERRRHVRSRGSAFAAGYEQYARDGFAEAVKKAVDSLPPMYREIVVLHYYNQMSYQQIQSVLGISGHVVKGRLARARNKIQAHLKREGFSRE